MRHDKTIIKKAFNLLYPEAEFNYKSSLIYSGRFSDYGANVRLCGKDLEFRLSKKWQNISEEIVLGLIQELLSSILKKKKKTLYIDLYNNFIKNLHIAIPKTKTEPKLKESFERINDRYFYGTIEQPNLVWGKSSTTQVGLYNFKTDTITISRALLDADLDIIDYVMYHEMLHKKTKFTSTNGRTLYHSKKFRIAEKAFENSHLIEKKLSEHVKQKKKRLRPLLFRLF